MKSHIRRAQLVAAVLAIGYVWNAAAQVQVTTIEDTVYRADGQRFDGIVRIEWRSFLAADSSTIAAYSKNVRVVNGILKTALVPTTTASVGAYYVVRYMIAGRLQTTEYWGVSSSTAPLRLKDVRLVGPPIGGQSASPIASPVTIAEVVGLNEELTARPKKGIGYTPSRVAVVGTSGDLESALGEPTDCVRVNGSSGACGTAANFPTFVDGEALTGAINGSNVVFTVSNPPNPAGSLRIYRNGLAQRLGLDYSLSGNSITFLSGSTPQVGDVLTADYRMAPASGQTGGQAGGALSGYYPEPSIAAGAIADQHIASNAGIQETKLALNYPTHTNANDPSPDQKAALAGTAGTVGANNRYVTDQDSRLTNARPPSGHPLLGNAHHDTNPGNVARGDLIVGLGTSPALWTRLPLGAANRCLTSNGFDAVWNTCLFTGFPVGSIPFADGGGVLTHNSSRLAWDNSQRRLSVGLNGGGATLTVQDGATVTGQTGVIIRAGEGQSNASLTRWQTFNGTDVAQLEADGVLQAARVKATSDASHAAWQETGALADPSLLANGHAWFNAAEHAHRTREGGQTHTTPQVICSLVGAATSVAAMTSLGTCTIPAALARTGDRFEIRFDLSHEGAAMAFSVAVKWANATLMAASGVGSEPALAGRIDVLPQGGSVYASWQQWGNGGAVSGVTSASITGALVVELMAQMASATAETVTLRNLTVVRYPGQANP